VLLYLNGSDGAAPEKISKQTPKLKQEKNPKVRIQFNHEKHEKHESNTEKEEIRKYKSVNDCV